MRKGSAWLGLTLLGAIWVAAAADRALAAGWLERAGLKRSPMQAPTSPLGGSQYGAWTAGGSRQNGWFANMKASVTQSAPVQGLKKTLAGEPKPRKPSQPAAMWKSYKTGDSTVSSKPDQEPDAQLHTSLAKLQEKTGNAKGAEVQYQKALAKDAKYLEALLGLARLRDRQGQSAEAVELYLKATRNHPREAAAFNDLGLCYARQQKFNESVAALRQAIKLKPRGQLYRNNLATVLVELGRTDEAVRELEVVYAPAIAHYNVGCLLGEKADFGKAHEHFSQALAYDPSLVEARRWVELLAQRDDAPTRDALAQLPPEATLPATTRGTQNAQHSERQDVNEPAPRERAPLSPSHPSARANGRSVTIDIVEQPSRDGGKLPGEVDMRSSEPWHALPPPTPEMLDRAAESGFDSQVGAMGSQWNAPRGPAGRGGAYFAPSRY